jgi:hypothetical protein
MSAADELQRLEREIEEKVMSAGKKPKATQTPTRLPEGKGKPSYSSFDLILALAAMSAIIGVTLNTVRQMPDEHAKTLRDGLIGGSAGLLIGYAIGRLKP